MMVEIIEYLRGLSIKYDSVAGKPKRVIKKWVAYLEKQKEQKPDTRTADDLQLLGFIYDLLASLDWRENYAMSKEECLRRLNDYRPQKPAEWSEFDKGVLKDAICATDILGNDESYNKGNPNLAKAFRVAKDWLKELPERFNLQPKPEWSEEDEEMLDAMVDMVSNSLYEPLCPREGMIAWLKSLLMRRPKKSDNWKPSEHQLSMLEAVILDPNNAGAESCHLALESLNEDLQKLIKK